MKKILVIAMAVLAMVGCKKQSELDFNDIAGKAVFQGTVLINQGYQKDGANYVVKNLPAANRTVVVKVAYKEYDSEATGDKVFETTTDANGFFSVEIPVGQVPLNNVYAETRPFTDKYYDLVNGEIQSVDAYYKEATSEKVTVENGKTTQVKDMVISKDITAQQNGRKQIVNITGVIKNHIEKKSLIDKDDADKGYKVEKDVQVAENVEVNVKFTNSDDSGVELNFKATTNAEGVYTIEANLFDTWDITKVKAELETKAYVSTTNHYYQKYDIDEKKFVNGKYSTQEISGYYDEGTTSKILSAGDLLIGTKLSDVVLDFTPDYAKETIYGIGGTKDGKEIDKGIIDPDHGTEGTMYKSDNVLGWYY